MNPAFKANVEKFSALRKLHLSEFPNWDEVWLYSFEWIRKFDKPKEICTTDTIRSIRDIDFLFNREFDLFKRFEKYDTKISSNELRDDWRIVSVWYNVTKNGGSFKYSFEDIIDLGRKIYLELQDRGIKLESKRGFEQELYDRISNESDIKLLSNLLEDCIVLKDFISLTDGSKIIVKLDNPSDTLKESIKTSIINLIPGMENKIEFVWGEKIKNAIPLYDLHIKRRKFKVLGGGRPRVITKETIEKIEKMTKDGATRPDIAREVGHSPTTVYNYQKTLKLI
jgi:hypothetical protein